LVITIAEESEDRRLESHKDVKVLLHVLIENSSSKRNKKVNLKKLFVPMYKKLCMIVTYINGIYICIYTWYIYMVYICMVLSMIKSRVPLAHPCVFFATAAEGFDPIKQVLVKKGDFFQSQKVN
jgi:hypothetical protein